MRIVTIVQARCGSSRLPGKSLRPLKGQPMVLHALERARAMGYTTWLATSDQEGDNLLSEIVIAAGFPVFRGSERDVLSRMLECALASQADAIIRVTGDCPLLAPDIGQRVVALWQELGVGIATNDTSTSGWPDGTDVEVFSTELLGAAALETAPPQDGGDRREADRLWRDREHVTPWLRRQGPHQILKCEEDWRHVKLSVDTEADFQLAERVIHRLPAEAYSWPDTRTALGELKFVAASDRLAAQVSESRPRRRA